MKEQFFDAGAQKKGIGFIGIFVIILVSVLIGSGATYMWMNRDAFSSQIESSPSPTSTPSISTPPEKTPEADIQENNESSNATIFTQIYENNCNSVVVIDTYITYEGTLTLYGKSSGFVMNSEGYILTNSHVVEEGESFQVTLFNGNVYEAREIGHDERTEVAVLKIDADEPLQPVVMGDSDKILIGEYAIAIGAPLGYEYSMSIGFVSGLQRTVDSRNYRYQMIQVDTALNSGNSGGPLFNIKGEVIGINTMKESSLSGASVEGIGFAVPINTAKNIAQQLIAEGKVTRAAIQAVVGNAYDEAGNEVGVYIAEITPGGAAEKAGLKTDDIIVKFNDVNIQNMNDLMEQLDLASIGENVALTIERDGKSMTLIIQLGST